MKMITVMQIPGRSAQVHVHDQATVDDAVNEAGMSLDGYTISVSPHVSGATGSTVVPDGSTVGLTRQVKGA